FIFLSLTSSLSPPLHSFPTRRSSDLVLNLIFYPHLGFECVLLFFINETAFHYFDSNLQGSSFIRINEAVSRGSEFGMPASEIITGTAFNIRVFGCTAGDDKQNKQQRQQARIGIHNRVLKSRLVF